MRAIAIERFGGPETLKSMNLPAPQPKAGEVLIRTAVSGVDPVDWKIREGFLQKSFPYRFPLILGWELAGVVEEAAEGATRLRRGDAVYAYARLPELHWGTYAELIALPEANVALKPRSLLFHESAAIPLAGLTAWQCLFRKPGVGPGTFVLIHAAAGGVGHLAVQLAKHAGATVIGTAGKANQVFIREIGVDYPIDYTAEDFRHAVRRIRPEGVDVVLDTVGGDVLRRSYDVVARGGRLVAIVDRPDPAEAERRGIQAYYHFVEPSGEELARLAALADEGKLCPYVSVVYPLAAAAEAQEKSRQGHTRGKIVLVL